MARFLCWENFKKCYCKFRGTISYGNSFFRHEAAVTSMLSGYLNHDERKKVFKHAKEKKMTVDQYLQHKYAEDASKKGKRFWAL